MKGAALAREFRPEKWIGGVGEARISRKVCIKCLDDREFKFISECTEKYGRRQTRRRKGNRQDTGEEAGQRSFSVEHGTGNAPPPLIC